MISTRYIRRFAIQRALQAFTVQGKVLEIGSGKQWRYISGSTTVNRDAKAEPDIVADAEHMDLPDASFDRILCIEALEHTPHPQQMIDEIHRLLKTGGSVLLTTPFNLEIHSAGDYFRYTHEGLALLFQKFSSVEIKRQGGRWSVIATLLAATRVGGWLYPLINNIGWYLDRMMDTFFPTKPRNATLGYAVVARK